MRRISPAVWILTPLALALLYAILHPFLAASPTVADLVPADAVLTMRFKDVEALDRGWFRPQDDPRRPQEFLAAQRNAAGLPGVDPHRPFHLVYLPRENRHDPTMLIFPVADADALRARFDDPSFFFDQGHVRHAQHLEIRGPWAAVGGDREAVRHLGEGGLTAEDLGEDFMVAIDVPALAVFALAQPKQPPWAAILDALGFDFAALTDRGAAVEAPRVFRVARSWKTARMWAFFDERRIQVDFEPRPDTPLAKALEDLAATRAPATSTPVPPRQAQAWLTVRGAEERAALAWALWSAGIAFPEALGTADEPLGAWGRAEGAGSLLVFAVPSIGTGHAWTLGVVAPEGTLPPLAPFHPAFPARPGRADAPAGELLLTLADLQRDRSPPAGRIVFARREGFDVVTVGTHAEAAQSMVTLGGFGTWTVAEAPAGWRDVAHFFLAGARAEALLGGELETGGLLAALKGGDLEGRLATDGTVLRLEIRVAEEP